ncbi:MAG: AAA family ATPase [Firmicutes bacterium]|jgi:AAA15 family ATPase/GTPase|nr:AAA family ATPase [Bacillota bacterium]
MIVSFSIENWMSFKDQATFSMIATRERQHKQRLAEIPKYRMKILPIAVIYGGNASGKTNFFKALNFVKNFIVHGTRLESLIPVEPFLLGANPEQPTKFELEILINELVYEFSFSVTKQKVIEEKLVQITSASEKLLYHRRPDGFKLHPSLKDIDFLNFAYKGTRENQLYLTNAVSQKVDNFKPVYDWFNNNLILIAPDMRFGPFEYFINENSPLYEAMNTFLYELDTGIVRLGAEDIPVKSLPEPLRALQEEVKEGTTVVIILEPDNERIILSRENGLLKAKKLFTYHQKNDGSEVRFDLRQEADGSQRIMDLIPAFVELGRKDSSKIIVIDEIDRSLHTLLTRRLLELYLKTCSKESRKQLLFTTHDVLLMDQNLFRRDEMWITERNAHGASSIMSFSEYKDVRSDKDIRKSYLQGRLGGIPRFLINDLSCIYPDKEDRGDA